MNTTAASKLAAEWSNLKLEQGFLTGPMHSQARHLSTSFGATSEVSAALLVSVLSAIVGPSRRVSVPVGAKLPFVFNIVFVCDSPVLLANCLRRLLAPLVAAINATKRSRLWQSPERAEESLTQARIQHLERQEMIDGVRPVPRNLELPYPGSKEAMRAIDEHEAHFHRQKLKSEQPKSAAQIAQLEYHLHPDYLTESLHAHEFLGAGHLSFDGSLVNFSFHGETLRSLMQASPETLAQISRLLALSWAAGPSLDTVGGRTPQISNVWLLEESSLSRFFTSESLNESGLLDTFLFLEVSHLAIGSTASGDDGDHAAWLRMVNYVFQGRLNGGQEDHLFTGEAAALLNAFTTEVSRLWSTLPRLVKPFAARWSDLAAKIALLLHIGSYDPQVPRSNPDEGGEQPAKDEPLTREISRQTVEAAHCLTKCLLASHLRIADRIQARGYQGGDQEVATMVRKIRLKQPVTRQTLFRSYSKMAKALHEPVLLKAIAEGLVIEDGAFLRAVDQRSGAQHSQSSSQCSGTKIAAETIDQTDFSI